LLLAVAEAYLTRELNDERSAKAIVKRLNRRLKLLPRASDFSLPVRSLSDSSDGDYFCKASRVQAKEHRNVHQIMMHIAAGLMPRDYVELAAW
jgi:hypothetical protein